MRRVRSAAIGLAVVAIAAGCSNPAGDRFSATSSSGPPRSALITALGKVAATGKTRQFITFSQPAVAVAANGGKNSGSDAYVSAIEPGSTLHADTATFRSEYGLDVTTTRAAITVWWPMCPHTWRLRYSTLLDGIDTSGFVPAAQRAGEQVRLSTGTATVRFSGPLSTYTPSGPLTPINTVEVTGDELRLAGSAADLAVFDPGGPRLADDARVAAVASCLNDPLAAQIFEPGENPRWKLPATITKIAMGTFGKAGVPATDDMCLTTTSLAAARDLARKIKNDLHRAPPGKNTKSWAELFTSLEVTVLGGDQHVVRVTGKPRFGGAGTIFGLDPSTVVR